MMKVAQLHPRCNDLWRCLDPTQYTRDEVHYSPGLEKMHIDEHQLQYVAIGSRGGYCGYQCDSECGAEFFCSSG